MSLPPLPSIAADANLALFLDVDGTLVEIAETPHAVVVPPFLRNTLNALSARLDGALALISGRSVRALDALFAPMCFAAAGVHGCERREANGCILRPEIDTTRIADARAELAAWANEHPGTLLEDKGYALALHYRLAPHLESAALSEVESVLSRLGTHDLQRGKFVFELRPAGYSKGGAIEAFMSEAPFRGRTPVFIGDDVTDEDGFAVVNQLDGISMHVGDPAGSVARYHFANVDEVNNWLSTLSAHR